ncbi:MAG: hypothetical protein R3185_06830 [Candidatus Thermoplasmatota archaeon]|nr:hypothetical protein [Candidatus Thermoplasmatota archaeon]
MRTPGTLGHLLPVALPGFVVTGALVTLVMPTFLGRLAFTEPVVPLVVGLLTAVVVFGYLLAAIQTRLAASRPGWALPPEAHLASDDVAEVLPASAVQRAGFATHSDPVEIPLGHAFALERALSGAWGTPEGAGWDRVAFIQRMGLSLMTAGGLAIAFLAGAGAAGAMSRGLRDHAGPVLVFGLLTGWLLLKAARRMRKEAILELLADARALLLDRGENTEVQRVLADVDLRLQEEELGVDL